jgi:hypothetical protein
VLDKIENVNLAGMLPQRKEMRTTKNYNRFLPVPAPLHHSFPSVSAAVVSAMFFSAVPHLPSSLDSRLVFGLLIGHKYQ